MDETRRQILETEIRPYFESLADLTIKAEITRKAMTDSNQEAIETNYPAAFEDIFERLIILRSFGTNKSLHKGHVSFIGNGGSAAIASHFNLDFWRAGGIPTQSFNDPAMLTCLANDFGYSEVFAKAVEGLMSYGDLLFAISSSGCSLNIVKAVETALANGCFVVTLSGFEPDNLLRFLGHVNFYIAAREYGQVECAHKNILHCLLDLFVKCFSKP